MTDTTRGTCTDLRGHDDQFECSECGTIAIDFAMIEIINNGVSVLRHYPDYCPNCGAMVTNP